MNPSAFDITRAATYHNHVPMSKLRIENKEAVDRVQHSQCSADKTYAIAPVKLISASGGMVFHNQVFVIFTVCERKNRKH